MGSIWSYITLALPLHLLLQLILIFFVLDDLILSLRRQLRLRDDRVIFVSDLHAQVLDSVDRALVYLLLLALS